jgi:hypothetical protein
LREIKIRDYTCGLIVTIAGFGLYSYYVRELLVALTIFSVALFLLALVALGGLLVWSASVQVALWARPASRSMIASSAAMAAFSKIGDCAQVNRRDGARRLGSLGTTTAIRD